MNLFKNFCFNNRVEIRLHEIKYQIDISVVFRSNYFS